MNPAVCPIGSDAPDSFSILRAVFRSGYTPMPGAPRIARGANARRNTFNTNPWQPGRPCASGVTRGRCGMGGRQSVRRKTCARRDRSGQGRAPCGPRSKAIRQLAAAPRLRSRSIVRAGIRARDRLRYVGGGRDRHAPGAALGADAPMRRCADAPMRRCADASGIEPAHAPAQLAARRRRERQSFRMCSARKSISSRTRGSSPRRDGNTACTTPPFGAQPGSTSTSVPSRRSSSTTMHGSCTMPTP
ncbi:hypothetical protein BURCE16_23430 [Burkholderia cepacia]|nr:hypothetical protein BURCE16_23430 [Burkholderia cepacia]